MGIGETAALGAAIFWTVSSLYWGRVHLSALGINVCKNWLGSALILLHLFVLARLAGQPVLDAPLRSWGYLSLSGVVGIVIGDTCYFRSLQILGPRRALIIASTAPLFAAVLGWSILRESLGWLAMSGVMMTVAGVIVVVSDRRARQEAPGLMPGSLLAGTCCGVVSAVCQAGGGVFSKLGMTRTVDGATVTDCSALEATLIRLFVAAIVTLFVAIYQGELQRILRHAGKRPAVKLILPATITGTWLGIWLSQIAFKESPVAIAQTLLATCPLFAIPLVWYLYGHRATWYSIVGSAVALVGIYFTVR
jgi:drug/metabolite transporter (DMT)-like permease